MKLSIIALAAMVVAGCCPEEPAWMIPHNLRTIELCKQYGGDIVSFRNGPFGLVYACNWPSNGGAAKNPTPQTVAAVVRDAIDRCN